MTATSLPAPEERARGQAALSAGLERLRRRAEFLKSDRMLLVVGAVFMPLGVVLVVAGWYGASHTTRLFEEVPYLISGGLLGLLIAMLGAAFYFGHWLTRVVAGQRDIVTALERIEEVLVGDTPAVRVADVVDNFVATPSGTLYHRPDCQVIASREGNGLRPIHPPVPGMKPCKLCLPEAHASFADAAMV
jgi:hypothetical protein